MESDKVTYLRRYRESPSAEKKVKFSDIEDDLTSQFPSTSWNSRIVSETVRAAFPLSESKQHGKSHHRYIHGIEISVSDPTDLTATITFLKESLEMEKMKNEQLQLPGKHLEQHITELKDLQSTAFWPDVIDSQIHQAMNPTHSVYHGPDTLDHFHSFSVDGVISELRSHAPDVFRLFSLIGKTDGHDDSDIATVTQLKAISSLVSLLKCRSVKVLGVQLLLTFMLIARATSKQVNICILNNLIT